MTQGTSIALHCIELHCIMLPRREENIPRAFVTRHRNATQGNARIESECILVLCFVLQLMSVNTGNTSPCVILIVYWALEDGLGEK